MSLDPCTHTIDLVDEGGVVTPVKLNINSDYTSLERKSLEMDSRHNGCDIIAISDISRTVYVGAPCSLRTSLVALPFPFHSLTILESSRRLKAVPYALDLIGTLFPTRLIL